MTDVFLELPLPPSMNHLYPTFKGRRILSQEGRNWYAKAIFKIQQQVDITWQKAMFPTERMKVSIWITFPDRRNSDISNRIKIVEDCLTKAHIWTDDSQIDELHVFRCPVSKENAGVKVMIGEII